MSMYDANYKGLEEIGTKARTDKSIPVVADVYKGQSGVRARL